jgi:hypothetical protein
MSRNVAGERRLRYRPCMVGYPGVTSSKDQTVEIARGFLLLGVFHIHALHALLDHLGDGSASRLAWWQIKLLSPHVVLFFALSGMTSTALADKTLPIVAARSLMLILVAAGSHAIGVVIAYALWKPWRSSGDVLMELVQPIVFGTGYTNFIGWFFVVLAAVRVLAFLLASNARLFALVAAIAVAAIVVSQRLGGPDNLYEWRAWPAALVLFVLGTRVASGWRVPHAVGLPAALAGLLLPLFNRPALWSDGACLRCDPQFVAQPMVGGYGFMPLYFAQEILAVFGLLWLARLLATTALAGALAWVGRRSLPLLVLHGWLVLSAYGVVAFLSPAIVATAGAGLFLAVFAANTLLHVMLYSVFAKPLGLFFMACSTASRRLVALARGAGRAARRRAAPRSPP